jgi:DNA-binding NarL/FixJ family response regulator
MVKSILIVDDSPTVRQALCEIFNREKDFDVCGEAANAGTQLKEQNSYIPTSLSLIFQCQL